MAYISNSSDFTATQKKNAQDAVSMLTGTDDKAEWYDQYVDPGYVSRHQPAFPGADAQRPDVSRHPEQPPQGERSVGAQRQPPMTVAAALNASYSSNIWGHSGCYWDNGENLAGGGGAYTGGETEDTLGWPYTGLYTQEKEAFDKVRRTVWRRSVATDMMPITSIRTTTASTMSAGTISTSSIPLRKPSVLQPVAVRTPIPR